MIALNRVVKIWQDTRVFDSVTLANLGSILQSGGAVVSKNDLSKSSGQ